MRLPMPSNSSKPSEQKRFKIDLAAPEFIPSSDDPIKDLCGLAVANVRRMDAIAAGMEKLLEEDLPASEMSRVARTILVARSGVVKIATAAVGDLVGPLRAKRKAKDL